MARFVFFFFFFLFAFATIVPVLLASRDIASPSPSDDDIDDYTMEGYDGETAESPEDDNYEVPEEPTTASEEPETEIPVPEPQPGLYRYVQSCMEVIPYECGQAIVDAIYKNSPLDGYCCHKVTEMGKDCNLALMKVIELVDNNESHVEEISKRGLQLWDHCVSLVSPSPSPSP